MKRIVRSHVMPRDESVTISVGSNQKLLDVYLFGDRYLELILEVDKTKSDATSKWDVQLIWAGETIPEGYTYLKDLSLPNGNRWHVYYHNADHIPDMITVPFLGSTLGGSMNYLVTMTWMGNILMMDAPMSSFGVAKVFDTMVKWTFSEKEALLTDVQQEGVGVFRNDSWFIKILKREAE